MANRSERLGWQAPVDKSVRSEWAGLVQGLVQELLIQLRDLGGGLAWTFYKSEGVGGRRLAQGWPIEMRGYRPRIASPHSCANPQVPAATNHRGSIWQVIYALRPGSRGSAVGCVPLWFGWLSAQLSSG